MKKIRQPWPSPEDYFQDSSLWAFGPPVKPLGARPAVPLRPLTPTLSPVWGEGVSALISWFLLDTDYWLLSTFRNNYQV